MKVHIGPYRSWFGPYQVAKLFSFLGEDFEEWLARKLPEKPFVWLDRTFKKRKVKIRIDNYDTWSMDHTLAVIILPMLKQLQATKHGSPFIEDEDVPAHLRRDACPAPDSDMEWEADDNFHLRWDWVLGEMIFAFECLVDDSWEDKFYPSGGPIDNDGYQEQCKRIKNGTRLFGVYFQSLWD